MSENKQTLSALIADIRNTKDVENLEQILPTFGPKLKRLIVAADRADKELDIVHNALLECYNFDTTLPIVRAALDKINELNP